METRDFSLKIKALEESGAFTGLASPYGDPPDLVGDVIAPGAFRAAIAHQGKGYPLVWGHHRSQPIGRGRVEEQPAGLGVHGKLVMGDPVAQRARAHMSAG